MSRRLIARQKNYYEPEILFQSHEESSFAKSFYFSPQNWAIKVLIFFISQILNQNYILFTFNQTKKVKTKEVLLLKLMKKVERVPLPLKVF